jgi:peptide/nickel transport system substrate-binding protein
MFHTWHAGSDCASPVGNIAIRTSGEKAWFGWPDNPEIEKDIAAWYDAKTLDEEKAIIARVNKMGMEHVTYIPTGFYFGYQAWRSNIEGVSNGPLPWFWGPKKA